MSLRIILKVTNWRLRFFMTNLILFISHVLNGSMYFFVSDQFVSLIVNLFSFPKDFRQTPEEKDKWWSQVLTSFHNLRIISPKVMIPNQNQCHHQQHWKPRNLASQCNYQLFFWSYQDILLQLVFQLQQHIHTTNKCPCVIKCTKFSIWSLTFTIYQLSPRLL